MTAFATQSNIQMTGAGLLGRSTASVGKSSRITIGSGLTLSGGVLSNSLDLSGYLPLTGGTLTGALSLGSNELTAGTIVMGVLDSTSTPAITLRTSSSNSGAEGVLFDRTFYGQRPKHGLTTRYASASADICLWGSGVSSAATVNGIFFVGSSGLGFARGAALATNPNVYLFSGGAGTLEQRDGLTAQCFDLFETYTSSTNNGKLRFKATSSGHQIGSARASSGSNRALQFGHFNSSDVFSRAINIATDGIVTIGVASQTALPARLRFAYDAWESELFQNYDNLNIVHTGGLMRLCVGGSIGAPDLVAEFGSNTQNSRRARFLGPIVFSPLSSSTLTVNGQFSIEMTSNTAGNLVYRGSDGTTRRMALTFS